MEHLTIDDESTQGGVITATVIPEAVDQISGELILAESVEPTTLATTPPPVIAVVAPRPAEARLLNSHAIVWAILLVLGPLGLPALWMSPRYSKTAKVLWTAVLLIGTVVLPIAMTWYWLDTAMQPLLDAFNKAGV